MPVNQKVAYKRPYKTRTQRRKDDRDKYTESSDRKFLVRMAGAFAILLALILGFMVKGAMDHSAVDAATAISQP